MEIDPPAFARHSHKELAPTTSTTTRSLPVMMSAVDWYPNQPRKRPRVHDDLFFQEGQYEYKAAWTRLNDKDAYIPDMSDTNSDHEPTLSKRITPQTCRLGTCHGEQTFATVQAYEQHFDVNHRYICLTCEKPFPGQKWLDLHLHEIHDVLVKIRKERGEKTFRCFVDGCERMCSTWKKRRLHLIDKHKYPKTFNFALVLTGTIPFAERMKHSQREKALGASRQRQQEHRLQSQILQQAEVGHMDIEPELKTNSPLSSSKSQPFNSSTSSISESRKENSKVVTAAPGPRPPRRAFTQYRQSGSLREATRMDLSSSADLLMSGPAEAEAHSAMAEDKADMDMDMLQQSMSLLMVPRSVAKRMQRQ